MFVKVARLALLNFFFLFCFFLISCQEKRSQPRKTEEITTYLRENTININTATTKELEKLPIIGQETAQKIIQFREKHGKFRRAEHLLLVRGMSDKKFRQLQYLISIE